MKQFCTRKEVGTQLMFCFSLYIGRLFGEIISFPTDSKSKLWDFIMAKISWGFISFFEADKFKHSGSWLKKYNRKDDLFFSLCLICNKCSY